MKRHEDGEEAGSTLVEILVAVGLMGSAIIVMVSGMSTLFASSIQNRQATTAGVVARDYGESLISTVAQLSTTDAWCSTTGYAVTYTAPTGYSVSASASTCPANAAATT